MKIDLIEVSYLGSDGGDPVFSFVFIGDDGETQCGCTSDGSVTIGNPDYDEGDDDSIAELEQLAYMLDMERLYKCARYHLSKGKDYLELDPKYFIC